LPLNRVFDRIYSIVLWIRYNHTHCNKDTFAHTFLSLQVKVTDFFGNVQNVELTRQRYPLIEETQQQEPNDTAIIPPPQQHDSTLPQRHSFHVQPHSLSFNNATSVFGCLATLAMGYLISKTITA
jgi:phosphatidylinositol glycan class K